MRRTITFLLFLTILFSLTNITNVKASHDDDEIKYEVFKRNPDLIITGCNETYVYWQFNYRNFEKPVPIRPPGHNETIYTTEGYMGAYDMETWFIVDHLAGKYGLNYSNWAHYVHYTDIIAEELSNVTNMIFSQEKELGLNFIEVSPTRIPVTFYVSMYKITEEKIHIVLNYLKPLIKKYNALVFIFEGYKPKSVYEKQGLVLDRFYFKREGNRVTNGDGWNEYRNLVKEYYNLTIPEDAHIGFSPGEANLPIPKNATLNEEFVRKAVSILRKYAGCEVPLVVNFVKFNYEPGRLPIEPLRPSESEIFLYYLQVIILFVILPSVILISLVYILRKRLK